MLVGSDCVTRAAKDRYPDWTIPKNLGCLLVMHLAAYEMMYEPDIFRIDPQEYLPKLFWHEQGQVSSLRTVTL